MNIKIIVATHKQYRMPSDPAYLPIHVGKSGKRFLGYEGDDTGENISEKNANYCELTGLYWAWKNLDADVIGLAHYRRHFMSPFRGGSKWERIITVGELDELCGRYDIIVSHKRKYYIENNYSHYIHAHHKEGLDLLCKIIKDYYPHYARTCDIVMNRSWGHMFNMFIMKRDYCDRYCEWLFDILFKAEERLDISSYSAVEVRVFGYISEFLLDIWIENNGYKYGEIPVKFMEWQNWLVKGGRFLMRKFL